MVNIIPTHNMTIDLDIMGGNQIILLCTCLRALKDTDIIINEKWTKSS